MPKAKHRHPALDAASRGPAFAQAAIFGVLRRVGFDLKRGY